jgi:hypothetical protein
MMGDGRTFSRIRTRDRRMASIHEAGHAVLAETFDLSYCVGIFPLPDVTAETWFESHTWIGTFRNGGRLIKRRGLIVKTPPTKRQERLIAVAGGIAEACWQYRNSDQQFECPWDLGLDYCEDRHIMSDSDWELAGCAPGQPDTPFFTAVEKVIELLRPNGGALWPDLTRTARNLIETSRPEAA